MKCNFLLGMINIMQRTNLYKIKPQQLPGLTAFFNDIRQFFLTSFAFLNVYVRLRLNSLAFI